MLQRLNVSTQLVDVVRDMIGDGALPDGERINEVHLAAKLGVSRTPLREALFSLVHDGTVKAVPHRGFYVPPLTVDEFEQIYAIRPVLDPEALRLAGVPAPRRLAELRALNTRVEQARKPRDSIALDDEWHLLLVETCPNRVLVDLIVQFMRRTLRYELANVRDAGLVMGVKHRAILAALARRDLRGACAALRENMERGRAPMVSWLKARAARRSVA